MTDELLSWRQEFPSLESCVHLLSHSLGCMPARAEADLGEFVDLWEKRSAGAWEAWLPELDATAARLEKLLSAPAGTVAIRHNVSELQGVVASCFDYPPERNKIVYSSLQFPTVSYLWKAEERRGAEVVIVESGDGLTVDADAICEAIDERTAVVPISHVCYSTGYVQDARKIAGKAASVGAHVVLDCYQSIGTIPLDLPGLGVSFAVGGVLKYMCGGPGVAFLYVRKDLVDQFEPRLTGWFAHESPFAFAMPAQSYADGIWRYMGGTPAAASLYQARAGQQIIGEIGVSAIREKSIRQTQLAVEKVDELGLELRCPRDPEVRSGSVIFDFVGAADVARELNRRRFFCDHRPDAGIRIAPHFYTADEEIERFFAELIAIRG